MHPQRPRQPPPEDAPSVQGPVYGSPSRHAGSVHTTVARWVLDISTQRPPGRRGRVVFVREMVARGFVVAERQVGGRLRVLSASRTSP